MLRVVYAKKLAHYHNHIMLMMRNIDCERFVNEEKF